MSEVSIPSYVLDVARLWAAGEVFPEAIERDEWVLFHGTSGYNAPSIERDGFTPPAEAPSVAEIDRLIAVFVQMKWGGADFGGMPVLQPFSRQHDLGDCGKSPIFFAATGTRALTFATRDFAGGEKRRAIRRCIRDLEIYLADPGVRQRHWDYQERCFADYAEYKNLPPEVEAMRPSQVDLAWLERELTALSEMRRHANTSFDRHDHGIIYAVRVESTDLLGLRWHPSMGIEADMRLPPARICGKVTVPADFASDPMAYPECTLSIG